MLDFLKPQHHILIQRIYRANGRMDDQKLSFFIYHLQLRPEKIASSIEYITRRGVREIQQHGKIDVTCAILTQIITHFCHKSVEYETVLFRNMAELLQELVKHDIYVACFQEYVLLCCRYVNVRTYRGDEAVNAVLEVVCDNFFEIKTYAMSNDQQSIVQLNGAVHSAMSTDSSGIYGFIGACSAVNYYANGNECASEVPSSLNSFFTAVDSPSAETRAGNSDIFVESSSAIATQGNVMDRPTATRNGNAMDRPAATRNGNVMNGSAATQGNAMNSSAATQGNAMNSSAATRNGNITYNPLTTHHTNIFETKELFSLEILRTFIAHNDLFSKDNYTKRFKIVLNPLLYNFTLAQYRSILKDIAKTLNAINISAFINLFVLFSLKYEVNSIKFLLENVKYHDVIVNELNKLISVERSVVLFLFYIEVINRMDNVQNVHEMSRFVFNVLKVYLGQDVRRRPVQRTSRENVEDTKNAGTIRTDVVEELYKRQSVRSNRFYPCIKKYVDAFLAKVQFKADVLYFFLKQSFQYDFSPSDKTMTVYSRDFQDVILSFVSNTELEVNLKMIDLLLHISEVVPRFKDTVFNIICKFRLCTFTTDLRGRHAIMCKIRMVYARIHDDRLRHVLESDDREKIANERLFAAVEAVKNGNVPTTTYNMDSDVIDYESYFGWSKSYASSLKSSLNFENISSKRRSFLRNMDVTKD